VLVQIEAYHSGTLTTNAWLLCHGCCVSFVFRQCTR